MIYKINLKPLESYFFGTSKKFIRRSGDKDKTNYDIDSNIYPQQTSILGMLRKEILKIEDLFQEDQSKYDDKEKIVSKIGSKGFLIDDNNETNISYGVIKKISEVFIERTVENERIKMFKGPFDFKISENGSIISNKLDNPKTKILKLSMNGRIKKNFRMIEWDRKKSKSPDFIGIKENKEFLKFDFYELFTKEDKLQIKIPNRRNNSGNNDTEMFRKQKYNFNNRDTSEQRSAKNIDMSFAFYADLELSFKGNKDVVYQNKVYLGGDKSTFDMSIETVDEKEKLEYENSFNSEINEENEFSKWYLLSDMYLEESDYDFIYENLIGGNLKYIDANCFTTKIENNMIKQYQWQDKTYKFIEKGSSMIFDKNMEDKCYEKLSKYCNFEQIGLNIIRRIK